MGTQHLKFLKSSDVGHADKLLNPALPTTKKEAQY